MLIRKLSTPEYLICFAVYPAFCYICFPCYFIKSSVYMRRLLLIWLVALYSVSQWKLDMAGLFVGWTVLRTDSSVISGELPLSPGQHLGRKGPIPAGRSSRCCHKHMMIRHCAVYKGITVSR